MWQINPNPPTYNAKTDNIPSYPRLFASNAFTALQSVGGAVGLALNGVSIYNCYGGPSYGPCTNYTNSAIWGEGASCRSHFVF